MAAERTQGKAGYRKLTRVIREKFDVAVKRDDVMRAARALDPEGAQQRKGRRARRRQFHSPVSKSNITEHTTYMTFIHIQCQ